MARPDDATKALRALSANAQLVIDACLEDGGRLVETHDNEKALQVLRSHRLVFELDEEYQQIQVSRVVSELVHHITQSYRRQLSSSAVAGMMDELDSVIAAFHLARNKASKDKAVREAEAQEIVAAMIDTLRQITQRFISYIHSEFSYVSDLDQRIHENRRALDEARKLNILFDTLDPGTLMKKAGPSPELQYLLVKVLRRNLDRLRKDLVGANHGLRENLARLEKDQQARWRSNMLESFLRHYEQNPGYTPDAGLLEASAHIPVAFCKVAPLSMRAQPHLDDASQHDVLRELLAGALSRQDDRDRDRDKAEDSEPIAVRDNRDSQVEVDPDPFDIALDHFFQALPHLTRKAPRVSCMAAYQLLEVAQPPDVWLIGIFGRYQWMLGEETPAYTGTLIEKVVPNYSGNHEVHDIVFEVRGHT